MDHEKKIVSSYKFLIKNVDPIPVLDFLIQRGHCNPESIRNAYKTVGPNEANRMIIESLPRMKDGRGYEHYIDALREENMDFVLKKLGYTTDVTSSLTNATLSASNPVAPTQSAQPAVENSEKPAVRTVSGTSLSINGAHLNESDGPAISQTKDDQYEDISNTNTSNRENSSVGGQDNNGYESYRSEPTDHGHEYDVYGMEGQQMHVLLVDPTTLQCSHQTTSSYPEELSALTTDGAWHAHINDRTIHKVLDDLCACPAGTYIMWYSEIKRAMLVSVAVPMIRKKHVHFKMIRTEKDGVPHYQFDSRFHSRYPLDVLTYVKKNGLIIKPAKLRKYME